MNVFRAIQEHLPDLTSLTFQVHYADNYRKSSEVALKHFNDTHFTQRFDNVALLGKHISYIPTSLSSKVQHLSLRGTSVPTSSICQFLATCSGLKSLHIGTLNQVSISDIRAMLDANPDITLTVNETSYTSDDMSRPHFICVLQALATYIYDHRALFN